MIKIKIEHDRVLSIEENKVLENLRNIASFCPSVILSDARKRRGFNKLLCDDSRANEFIKLDCEISIDQDDEDVKKFGNAIFDWVASLCDLIRYKSDLNFTVVPSGSFPLNVKVENLNEFDYLIMCEDKSGGRIVQDVFDGMSISFQGGGMSSALLYVLKLILIKSENLSDISLMRKCNAININFSWLCSSNHKHSVSIDLAISIKTSNTIKDYFNDARCSLKGTPFEDFIDSNEKMYWNCSFIGSRVGGAVTNIFDKQILETCDGISPNIRLCYRVLKFIRDCFFPGLFARKLCHLAGDKNYLKECFSSYSLKQVLYWEVIEFCSSDHWQNDFIHLRIASMLQKLSKYRPDQDIFDKGNKSSTLDDATYAFMPILTNMMQWLYDGCERIPLLQRSKLQVRNKGITVLFDNKVLVSLPKHLLHCDSGICDLLRMDSKILIFKPFRPLLFQNKILGGLYEAFNDVVESMEHVDLTSFSDENVSITVCMLRFFIITRKDIDSNNYSKKLNCFKEMLSMYKLSCSDVFEKFLDFNLHNPFGEFSFFQTLQEIAPPIFISLEAIFTSITWEERSYIYRSFDKCYERYTEEKSSKAMKQLSDKVIDLVMNFPFGQALWIFVSINTLIKLN